MASEKSGATNSDKPAQVAGLSFLGDCHRVVTGRPEALAGDHRLSAPSSQPLKPEANRRKPI